MVMTLAISFSLISWFSLHARCFELLLGSCTHHAVSHLHICVYAAPPPGMPPPQFLIASLMSTDVHYHNHHHPGTPGCWGRPWTDTSKHNTM